VRFFWMLCISVYMQSALATPSAQVFVSFSMPEQLLSETLSESARLHIPALLNGLIENSMPKTVGRIVGLSKKIPNLNLQIDPTAFEKYGIQQVPALVVDNGQVFDVLYGNLLLRDGLLKIADGGESGLSKTDIQRLYHE
jgi:conjugal transfer pilus assembly protein TrbC